MGFAYDDRMGTPRLKDRIDRLIATSPEQSHIVRAFIERLFPAAIRHISGSHYGGEWKASWLVAHRVAHEHMLRLYLEQVAGEGFQAFSDAERAWLHMADGDSFASYLRSINLDRVEDVISSLEVFEDQFRPEHVVPGVVALLNILPESPDRPRGMLGIHTRRVVGRVVYRLVRSVKTPAAIEAAVVTILPKLTTLAAKDQLITIVGYQEGAGHKLITESRAREFERAWRDEVRSATVDKLAAEPELLITILRAQKTADQDETPLQIPDSPGFALALLWSARTEAIIQSSGSRAVRRSYGLAWDALVEVFGDEDVIRTRVDQINVGAKLAPNDPIELARRYLGGWRPNDRDED